MAPTGLGWGRAAPRRVAGKTVNDDTDALSQINVYTNAVEPAVILKSGDILGLRAGRRAQGRLWQYRRHQCAGHRQNKAAAATLFCDGLKGAAAVIAARFRFRPAWKSRRAGCGKRNTFSGSG